MLYIIYAGFGVWNAVLDVTDMIKRMYGQGTQEFSCDGCKINGYEVNDPSPGNRKYLYVVYSHTGHPPFDSAVTWEGDQRGITIPLSGL